MAKMYYDKDADMSILQNTKIAINGFGSQGHAQAQNLRDSGFNVIVAELEGTGPLLTTKVEKLSASAAMGLGGLFQRVFGLSFIVRPVFKIVLGICGFIVGALLTVAGLAALGRFAGFVEKR
jgi:hypothetical protein